MKYDDDRVEELPQWAKNLIADLTRAADEARSELDRRLGQQPEEVPLPPLPTAPYTVIGVSGRSEYDSPIFVLRPGGEWCNALDAMFLSPRDLRDSITGFEVLSEPRAVTAKAVLGRLLNRLDDEGVKVTNIGEWIDMVGREFGVES